MKKNLHRIIMSALLTVVATVAASAQCYIVGSDNQWKTNAAAAELTETATAGVYEGEVTFAEGAQYFTVTQNLTTGDDDYDWQRLINTASDLPHPTPCSLLMSLWP